MKKKVLWLPGGWEGGNCDSDIRLGQKAPEDQFNTGGHVSWAPDHATWEAVGAEAGIGLMGFPSSGLNFLLPRRYI